MASGRGSVLAIAQTRKRRANVLRVITAIACISVLAGVRARERLQPCSGPSCHYMALDACQYTRYKTYMATASDSKREHDRVFQMRVSDAFLDTLDGWRREQPDIPSRAEAVRRLVDQALRLPADHAEALIRLPHRDDSEGAD